MPNLDDINGEHTNPLMCPAVQAEARRMGTYFACCLCTDHACSPEPEPEPEPLTCGVCNKPIKDRAVGTCLCLPSHGSWHLTCDPHLSPVERVSTNTRPTGEKDLNRILNNVWGASSHNKDRVIECAIEAIEDMCRKQRLQFIKEIEAMKYDKKSPSVFEVAYNLAIANIVTRLKHEDPL